jgi:hypothetical protein
LFLRQDEDFPAASIDRIFVEQGQDVDGDPVFRLQLQLRDGRQVPLTRLWLHDRPGLEANASLLMERLPRDAPGSRPNF